MTEFGMNAYCDTDQWLLCYKLFNFAQKYLNMKNLAFALLFLSTSSFAQEKKVNHPTKQSIELYVKAVDNLTLEAAFELQARATLTADSLHKKVTIALLDASGEILMITRGESVGPHNTEAARRKAYTALSTKTGTLELMRNAALNSDSKNLNTLPELLLLSGGVPIWYKGNVIGSIGIAGGGSADNDNLIAKSVSIPQLGISTSK